MKPTENIFSWLKLFFSWGFFCVCVCVEPSAKHLGFFALYMSLVTGQIEKEGVTHSKRPQART